MSFRLQVMGVKEAIYAGRNMRQRAGWMTPLDDEILELMDSADIVLSPSIIAYNIERSREGVAHRLSQLTKYKMIEKVERGKYRIREEGREYLAGQLDAEDLELED